MVGTTGKPQSVSQRRFNAVNEDAMTRSTLFALTALLAASLLSAPSQGQQQPPAAGARPPAAAPPAGQSPSSGQPGSQQAGQPGAQQGGPSAEGQAPSGDGPPWPVLVVTSVETLRSHIKGHLEIIRVSGLVTSGGWVEPHLLPIAQGEPLSIVLFSGAGASENSNRAWRCRAHADVLMLAAFTRIPAPAFLRQ